MKRSPPATVAAPATPERHPAAPSGRERLVRNVLASWAGHLLFMACGFILPRVIDRQVGQAALGVWDFGWSLVAYFALVQGGVVSSVNRYVARYHAAGDREGINRAVSSVTCVLVVMAGIIVALAALAAWSVPLLMHARLGEYAQGAGWIVLLLGMSLAVQTAFSGYGGVLTGLHRWDLHNAIHAATRVATVSGMLVVLLSGRGLVALAVVNLGGELAGRLVRCYVAYRICPTLRVRLAHAERAHARRMLAFGGKTFVPQLGELALNSTTSLLIVAFLGPAALALYSRPMALVRHVRTLVQKFAFVLTPTASALQAADRQEELRRLLVAATRYGAYITLPMITTLAILGGPLLRLWMGPRYERGAIVMILAVGHLVMLLQRPALNVLTGLNAHGRPGVANLAASLVAIVAVALALGPLQGGLVAVALAVGLPITLANGVYVPLYISRRLNMPVSSYVTNALRGPLLCLIPFALCLGAARLAYPDAPFTALAVGGGCGALVLAALYWRFALPASMKERVVRWTGGRRCLRARSPA